MFLSISAIKVFKERYGTNCKKSGYDSESFWWILNDTLEIYLDLIKRHNNDGSVFDELHENEIYEINVFHTLDNEVVKKFMTISDNISDNEKVRMIDNLNNLTQLNITAISNKTVEVSHLIEQFEAWVSICILVEFAKTKLDNISTSADTMKHFFKKWEIDKLIDLLSLQKTKFNKTADDNDIYLRFVNWVSNLSKMWTRKKTTDNRTNKAIRYTKNSNDIWNYIDNEKISNFSEIFNKLVIGQKNAGDQIKRMIYSTVQNQNSNDKSKLVACFAGPMGIGKHVAIHSLSSFLFNRIRVSKFDMYNYRDLSSLEKLIGINNSNNKYVPGKLTTAIKKHPNRIINFSHIDYAHPEVIKFLTKIVRSGFFTTPSGEIISMKDNIIIFNVDIEDKKINVKQSPEKAINIMRQSMQIIREQNRELSLLFDEIKLDNFIYFNLINDYNDIKAVISYSLDEFVLNLANKGIKLTNSNLDKFVDYILNNLNLETGFQGLNKIYEKLESELLETIDSSKNKNLKVSNKEPNNFYINMHVDQDDVKFKIHYENN